MILVRLVFRTKWGKASEVANAFKESERILGNRYGHARMRVLTDLSGPFHTVVQEIEVESLAQWERTRGEIFANPEFQKNQASIDGLIESGSAEFYTIE